MDKKDEIQEVIESKDIEACSKYLNQYYELCKTKESEIRNLNSKIDNLNFKIKREKLSKKSNDNAMEELLNKNLELEIKNKELSKIIKYFYDLPLKNRIFSFVPKIGFISKSYFNWVCEYNTKLDSRVNYIYKRIHTFEKNIQENNSFYQSIKNRRITSITEEHLFKQLESRFDHRSLTLSNYESELIKFAPEFFICESVKAGPKDKNNNTWKGKIYHSTQFNYENRKEILNILDICTKRNITSIFIFNRDVEMIDNLHLNFIETALKFDYLFVTTAKAYEKLKALGYNCYYFKETDTQTINYSYVPKKKKTKKLGEFNCVTILDEFSHNAFSSVFNVTPLEPQTAIKTICDVRPDFFLCESAWKGISNDNIDPWKGKIYSSDKFDYENRKDLIKIIDFCNENNIPTIFWNKEDPTHFDDMHTNFVDTAGKFDTIFTTAIECVEKYETRFDTNIGYLPFGTPIFIPQKSEKVNEKITFFGGWYNIHKDRCKDMKLIFDLLVNNGFELEIFDRFSEEVDSEKKFPSEYKPYIKKAITQVELWEKYGSLKYGINISTVTDSNTMVARRVFELALSEVLIISNEAKAIGNIFGDNVIILPRDIEKLKNLTEVQRVEMVSNCKKIVLDNYLQGKIAIDMLDIANISVCKDVRYIRKIKNISEFRVEKMNTLYVFDNNVDSNEFADVFSRYNSEKTNIVLEKYFSLSKNELYYTGNINDDIYEFINMAIAGVKVHTSSGQLFIGGKDGYIDYHTNV